MWSAKFKGATILAICLFIAVNLGNIIGSGDYGDIILFSYGAVGLFVASVTGYVPLIAFGVLSPFILPIPMVRGFPFLALMLGVCVVKLVLKESVTHTEARNYRRCLTFAFGAFFAWVLFRYLLKPVMPNLSGIGVNITGFRSYLNYATCFGLVIALPFFIRTREDALRLMKWLAWISLGFIALLVPLMLTKSPLVAMWLQAFGLFVTNFGNGWLRFVVLPGFGLVLVTLVLLPQLLPLRSRWRVMLTGVGVLAIVLGGNRSTLAMALIAGTCIITLRQKYRTLLVMISCAVLGLGFARVLGEGGYISSESPVARIIALVSPRMAQESGAEGTVFWREMRADRAIEEIKQTPWLGKGYGGLENAWAFGTAGEAEEASLDIDMATGGIHNGFLTSAYSLGIPATLLFLIACVQQLYRSARHAQRWVKKDPVLSQLQCFACANLAALLLAIYIGTDLNGPIIWFYLALSVIFTNLKEAEAARPVTAASVAANKPMAPLPAGFTRPQAG